MPKKHTRSKKARKIPKEGRKRAAVQKDMGLQSFTGMVQIGNTGPTMVEGILWGHGGVPNAPRRARGSLVTLKGKR